MKNIYSKFLLTVLLSLGSIVANAYDFEVDGIYYQTLTGKTCEVSWGGEGACCEIPSEVIYDGTVYSVTGIQDWAFSLHSSLTSVIIPNSVISIASYAFLCCSALTSITIPSSVKSIGECAFTGCSALTSIEVENGNSVYDSRENCNAIIETNNNKLIQGCQNSVIPNSVTSIGGDTFYDCSGLTSISIPNSVTSIGERAFDGCSGLTSIAIPSSVTSIGESAFSGCSSLTSITIPSSVTNIGNWTFNGCSALTSITIPSSVTSIGEYAFKRCI